MKNVGDPNNIGAHKKLRHFPKYLLCIPQKKQSFSFGTALGVNDDRIFLFCDELSL